MLSICENWIASNRIDESGNDFLKNLYGHGILFWYCKIQGANENILIFQPYVCLIVISSVKPKLGYVWFVGFGHRD